MISASLKKLMAQMRRIIPDVNVTFIHFSTNSSSSQYRNTHMFNILLRRELLFAIKVAWNYFKACHGKGPCDGLTVTTKGMAITLLNNTSLSSNMLLVSFPGMSQGNYPEKSSRNLSPPRMKFSV